MKIGLRSASVTIDDVSFVSFVVVDLVVGFAVFHHLRSCFVSRIRDNDNLAHNKSHFHIAKCLHLNYRLESD